MNIQQSIEETEEYLKEHSDLKSLINNFFIHNDYLKNRLLKEVETEIWKTWESSILTPINTRIMESPYFK